MASRWPPFLLATAALLLGPSSGSSSHSLHHFYLGVSESTQGLPRFTQVGYLDDQLVTRYNISARRDRPQVSWLEKAEDTQYWDRETHDARLAEDYFKKALLILQRRFNQSGGLHTWQCLVGCELSKDGEQKGRSMQCGYDGRDFISLDKETFTWTAADAKAQVTKRKWEADPDIVNTWKGYLEEECIESLQKCLVYANATLLRTEPPTVKVARKMGRHGLETLICRAHGFYPKEIDATWRKDKEVWEHETFRGGVTPNSDGTYHTWLSIEIDPKDRERYRCHVEHDGLLEPLDLALEDPASAFVAAIVVAVIVAALVAVIILFISIRKYQKISAKHCCKLCCFLKCYCRRAVTG
ncbi:major histocompatibility complex class I-related gene protein-like [Hemicordylus capensis]|uniref:major histocompatibility complex class I-related gene protein-like n=1 Tax=Hemicordylus capensis TaxID=884348 RepID=UPI0023022357|nr:major histocompatibility complex class I-related gene protein-like [Hemicordylus capensis]